MNACESSWSNEMIETILSNGADPNTKNNVVYLNLLIYDEFSSIEL